MKFISSSGIWCLVALSACGQVSQKKVTVTNADLAKVRAYESKSRSYQDKNPDSAIYYANRGLKLSRRLKYPLGEALMLTRFARINEQYNNLKLAVSYQKEALAIYDGLHNPFSADASASLGLLEGKRRNFKLSALLITNALKQYEGKNDTAGMISTYTKLGEIRELSGNSVQALLAYSRAEQLNHGRPVNDEYFSLIGSIGKLHGKLGNHQRAAIYYEKGISQSGTEKHIKKQIAFLNHAGNAWNKLGNKEKALAYHKSGLLKAKAGGLPEEEARSLIGIARVLRDQDAVQSITHLQKALIIARSIGQKQLSAEIYRSLSDEYRQQSQYQEALDALEEHHRLLDSLVNVNAGHKIAVLQSSYELTESKLRVEALELSNQKRTEQRNKGLFAAAAVLVILLVLAFYYYKTQRLNQGLAASNLIKDKLFSIIGHDLRNPIGGITQLLEVLEEENLTGEQRQMVAEMRKQGNVSLDILNALLNWGEAQLKGVHIRPSNFNAKNSINKNIAAQQKHISDRSIIVTDHTPTELMIYGDINHFEFIIRNLLSNAIKFSYPSGAIEITADLETIPDQVIFSVRDHGKGINPQQQQLFLKANLDVSFGTKGETGTGIGLMLSKEFIKANKGKIWLESEEGKGSVFYFTFFKQAFI